VPGGLHHALFMLGRLAGSAADSIQGRKGPKSS
jgi:hypothetical protein